MQTTTLRKIINDYNWLTKSSLYEEFTEKLEEEFQEESEEEFQANLDEEFEAKVCDESEQIFAKLIEVINFWGVDYLNLNLLDNLKIIYDSYSYPEFESELSSFITTPESTLFVRKFKLFFMLVKGENPYYYEEILKYGYLDILKWATKSHFNPYTTFFYAAYGGHLETMKWLKQEGCRFDYQIFTAAAANGNLENMKWLKENNFPRSSSTFTAAAKNGNLENMKWLKREGFFWSSSTFTAAAKNGNLENMKWLKQEGCPWGPFTFTAASRNGNLENMKWLKQEGCPRS